MQIPMGSETKTTYEGFMAGVVTRYATPLAIAIVLIGVFAGRPGSPADEICLGLISFGVLFNLFMASFLGKQKSRADGYMRLRLLTNVAINVVLVYFLFEVWPSVWFLLVLTPFATAVYENRERTLASSAGISLILLTITILNGVNNAYEWGELLTRCLIIFFVSLLINEISLLARRGGLD